jgi:hypothetical protein
VKWLRKLLRDRTSSAAGGQRNGGPKPQTSPSLSRGELEEQAHAAVPQASGGGAIDEIVVRNQTISARLDFSNVEVEGVIDSHGCALQAPPERKEIPVVCRGCDQLAHDSTVQIAASPAYAWRRLGLIEADGTPTRRGVVFSFFQGGEGLAIAAALEDESYKIDDLVFDLANIRGGPRFAGEDAVMGGRLGILCQRVYDRADHPGYLEMGVPVHYGSGASEVIREVVMNAASRYKLTTDALRSGDIERALMEWRSLLRHIVHAPRLDWDRWVALKASAQHFIDNSTSPTILEFPPLLATQQRRIAV